ncbi:MAG: YqaJ viral recombinase family protein [Actinomycetia bacterium]|nr:YqaJ viral recombinase family protein [Actinomycetes bacterium]
MATSRLPTITTPTRADWLAARRQGLGGSDMAAIMGLNPYKTALDVFLEKIGEAPETPETEAMYWGSQLEDLIAREFARRTGYKVQRRRAMLRHPTIPYLLGNVDRIVVNHPDGPAVLECKTTHANRRGDWADGQAPVYYVVQLQHYLDLTGYRQGYLAVLIGGQEFRIVPVPRNDGLIAQMHDAAEAFWLCVETRTPPVIDGSAAAAKALQLLYPQGNGTAVDLPPEAAYWSAQWLQAQRQIAAAEAVQREASNHLKALLGEAERGRVAGYDIRWAVRTRKTVDTKALKAARPDVAAAFERETTYREFTVKEV